VKTSEKHVTKVFSCNQRDWDERISLFLLSYRVSTHETTGVTPTIMVFGRDLRLPCDLMFGAPPVKGQSMMVYAADLAERLRDTHNFARQHLESGQRQNEGPLRPTGQLGRFPRRRQCVYILPHTEEWEVHQGTDMHEGFLYRLHPHQRCCDRVQRNLRAMMMVVRLRRVGRLPLAARQPSGPLSP
jgi:hypothetical protein